MTCCVGLNNSDPSHPRRGPNPVNYPQPVLQTGKWGWGGGGGGGGMGS